MQNAQRNPLDLDHMFHRMSLCLWFPVIRELESAGERAKSDSVTDQAAVKDTILWRVSIRICVEISMSNLKLCELDNILGREEAELELLTIGLKVRNCIRQSKKRN